MAVADRHDADGGIVSVGMTNDQPRYDLRSVDASRKRTVSLRLSEDRR